MRQRKYALPRHTNLAGQGSRIGACLIDFTLFFGLLLGLFFGAFQWVFKSRTNELAKEIDQYRLDTALFYKAEDGSIKYYTSDDPDKNQNFLEGIHYFYTVYIPFKDVNADKPMKLKNGTLVDKKEYFTTEFFNENIIFINSAGADYFEYVKDGETPIKSQLALIKADADPQRVNSFLQKVWNYAITDLNALESFDELNNKRGFLLSLEIVFAALVSSTVVYIVLPIALKNGTTLGKKLFGLCLADSDGYIIKNQQLLMRVMPLDVVILALLIPIWDNVLIIFIVFTVILLTSFALSMASPKHSALHDFTAKTVVVNAKTSILFDNALDEEEYIAKEDNEVIEDIVRGEEPELRYEK